MPERKTDNTFIGIYRAAEPVQDRRNHPTLVPAGSYPRLIGVDGRFAGSFRRFPGFFSVVDIAAVPIETQAGWPTTSIPADAAAWFFKYVTVQVIPKLQAKGNVDTSKTLEPLPNARARVFRGFVVAHPYTIVDGAHAGESHGVLRYVYVDPMDGAWKSKVLLIAIAPFATNENVSDIDAGNPTSTIDADSEIDVASYGPFITYCLNPAIPPDSVSTTDGSAPRAAYRKSIRVVSTGALITDLEWQFTEFGPLRHPPGWDTTADAWITSPSTGTITGASGVAVRVFSLFKNVEGPLLQEVNKAAPSSANSKYFLNNSAGPLPSLAALGVDDDLLGFRLRGYRTLDSDSFSVVEETISIAGGTFFREVEVGFNTRNGNPALPSGAFPEGAGGTGSFQTGTYNLDLGESEDAVIARGARVDPFRDDTAFAPERLHRLLMYQGTLLRMGTTPIAGPPKTTVDRDNILSWGSLQKFSPEQCRIVDSTPLGSQQDEVIHSLVSAGDYAFAVGDSGVFRLQRSGQVLSVTQLQSLTGGVGRYAAIGVGTSLFFVAPNAMYVVDGATGSFQVVTVMDRIINEDWRGALGSIRMAYDNRLGALFILNTDKEEAVVLWSNTGVVTTLKDMNFAFGTEGVNPADAGFHRSFWLTQKGLRVLTPNADRTTTEALTMAGGHRTGSNGFPIAWMGMLDDFTLGVPTITPTFFDLGIAPSRKFPILPDSYAYVYVLTGAFAGSKSLITVSSDERSMQLKGLPGTILATDIISIAPVVFEIIGWPLQNPQQGLDVFQVKVVTSVGHNIQVLGGTTSGTHSMNHRLYRRGDLNTIIAETSTSLDADPSKNYSYINQRGPTIHPSWVQLSSDLDFELLSGIVHAKMTSSEAESSPG